jgi:hypothetical protein
VSEQEWKARAEAAEDERDEALKDNKKLRMMMEARAPSALPVGWGDETLEAMCRAHDAEESAQMGEPSLWVIHDRGDADGTDWTGTEEGWETYRTDRIAAMRAAVAMLSASPSEPGVK